jgi:hypothetical protein
MTDFNKLSLTECACRIMHRHVKGITIRELFENTPEHLNPSDVFQEILRLVQSERA